MKLDEVFYVLALVACALLATATNQCGGTVDPSPADDDDAGCVCIACIAPTPLPCDAPNAKPIEHDR